MKLISVDSSEDRFIVSIDKNLINKEQLLQFIDNLRIEFLAQNVGFTDDIEIIGEEIKQTWWDNNKDKYVPKEAQ